jgi:hypothetical protein
MASMLRIAIDWGFGTAPAQLSCDVTLRSPRCERGSLPQHGCPRAAADIAHVGGWHLPDLPPCRRRRPAMRRTTEVRVERNQWVRPSRLRGCSSVGSRTSEGGYEKAFRVDVGTIHFTLNGRRYLRFAYERARRLFEQTEAVFAFFPSARHLTLVARHIARPDYPRIILAGQSSWVLFPPFQCGASTSGDNEFFLPA